MAVNQGITHQLRRGTSAQMAAFTGAQGEPTLDTTHMRLVCHDGATVGGFPVESAAVQTFIGSAGGVILPTVAMVYVFGSTLATTLLQLPPVASYPQGQRLSIVDAGATSTSANIIITTSTTSEQIYSTSGSGSTSVTISVAGNMFRLMAVSTSGTSTAAGRWAGLYKT